MFPLRAQPTEQTNLTPSWCNLSMSDYTGAIFNFYILFTAIGEMTAQIDTECMIWNFRKYYWFEMPPSYLLCFKNKYRVSSLFLPFVNLVTFVFVSAWFLCEAVDWWHTIHNVWLLCIPSDGGITHIWGKIHVWIWCHNQYNWWSSTI